MKMGLNRMSLFALRYFNGYLFTIKPNFLQDVECYKFHETLFFFHVMALIGPRHTWLYQPKTSERSIYTEKCNIFCGVARRSKALHCLSQSISRPFKDMVLFFGYYELENSVSSSLDLLNL